MTGRVHSFQSLGTLDGPGLRSVVFLQGCPLRCGFCHNPDTWDFSGGEAMEAADVAARVRRYKPYFGAEGGLTVSGGEALAQAGFAAELFERCHRDGIHTCLDTSGCLQAKEEAALLAHTDLCLLDIKFTTDEEYVRYTGGHLDTILAFLGRLEAAAVPVWIRQVIVPGLNDTLEQIDRLSAVIAPYRNIRRVELLPFHKLCLEKYQAMGIPFPFDRYRAALPDELAALQARVRLPASRS